MARQQIDRDKLRAAIRREGNECIFHMLDVAIELMPQAKLRKLIEGCLNPAEIYANSERKPELLAAVQAFQKASLAGKYYQAFAVNSKSFMDISNATLAWMADCHRHLDQCIAQVQRKEDPVDQIDAGDDGTLFFADEGGSSALGIDWEKVLPAWFRILSATADPASTRSELTRS